MGDAISTQCPVCRARLRGDEPLAEPCRRCGSDLSLVRAAERQARKWRAAAQAALDRGDARTAVLFARRSVVLVDSDDARALLRAAMERGSSGSVE